MDDKDNPIEGFVRRPKKPKPMNDEIIEISDDDSGGETSVPRNVDLEPVLKCEATANGTTDSEISIPVDVIIGGKNKRKKNKKIAEKVRKLYKKLKRELKKENDSEEGSRSDSDSSHDADKRREKLRSESSSLSTSSNSSSESESDYSYSDSESSDNNSRRKKKRKKTHHRSKKSRSEGKKTHSSLKRNRKTKKSQNSERLKREKESTDESRSSNNQSSPDRFDPNNGRNNSNQLPHVNLNVMDAEAGAPNLNFPWHSSSQFDFPIPEVPTQLATVPATTTANENGHGKLTYMDQIVPLARYVDDGEVPGTSRQSLAVNETELEIMQFVENSSIEYVSELANDENHLLQSVSLNESDSEQQVEPEINVDSSGRQLSAINLQRPRANTDKMLYLTNPERANVCVFCYDSFRNIVNHYKKKHPTEEVYVSRISPRMADRLRRDDFERFEAKCEKIRSFWILRARCFFCEYTSSYQLPYWLDHIRVHTGEYARECISCGLNVTAHKHCGFATENRPQQIHYNLASADLMCFVCKTCNFVQIEKKNMQNHLTKQHGFHNNELESKYDERMLLPSKITVCRGGGPTTVQRANGMAVINQQENAPNIRVLDEMVFNPINNGAPEPNATEPNAPESNTLESNTLEPNEPPQSNAKREIGWKERLENIYQSFKTDEDNESVVNPWYETKMCKKDILPANWFDFYKCMHPNCIFSTNERTDMQDHIKDHFIHIDIGVREGDPIDIHKKSRICPYCCLGPFQTVNNFLNHMETMHSSCTYQCSYCYYRCIEMDSIVLHYEKIHPNEEKNIYIVNNERKLGSDKIEQMENVEAAKDPKQTTQFHEFECSYCDFESSQVNEMRYHLAEHHSSEYMFVLRRGEKDEYIYVGEMSQWTNFKFFKCGKYMAMSKYLDWDQQNRSNQPDPFPYIPVLATNFGFEPSALQIADDVRNFVYRKYEAYKNSQTLSVHCGPFTPEYLMEIRKNPDELNPEGSICRICLVYMEDPLRHLKEHQKTHCYFTAEREDLILPHIQRMHPDKRNFYYTKYERKDATNPWNESSIQCFFGCGICSEKFLCLQEAHKHHKNSHKNDVQAIQITRKITYSEQNKWLSRSKENK